MEARTGDHIEELREKTRRYFRRRSEELQNELDVLRPENAHLREIVRSAGILDCVSLALIAAGGGLLSYAAFLAEPTNHQLAKPSGSCASLSGIALSLVLTIYR